MCKRKPNKTTDNVRIVQKTNVAKREQTNVIDSANRVLGITTLLIRSVVLLESLPWDKIHHLIR
jgi:hypothetical protein